MEQQQNPLCMQKPGIISLSFHNYHSNYVNYQGLKSKPWVIGPPCASVHSSNTSLHIVALLIALRTYNRPGFIPSFLFHYRSTLGVANYKFPKPQRKHLQNFGVWVPIKKPNIRSANYGTNIFARKSSPILLFNRGVATLLTLFIIWKQFCMCHNQLNLLSVTHWLPIMEWCVGLGNRIAIVRDRIAILLYINILLHKGVCQYPVLYRWIWFRHTWG